MPGGASGGVQVCGVSLPTDGTRNLDRVLERITLRFADLGDYDRVLELLDTTRPDLVFHLAAQASVERAWANPAGTLVNNVSVQLNLLQAIVALKLTPRMLVIGSADEYGAVSPADMPMDEDTPLRPLNPYAVSKIAQDYLGLQYHLSHGLHVVRVRPFNHIGPRQGPGFALADWCRQIASIEAGLQEPVMRVGNLDARRDFSDVRDIVRGYYLALMRGQPGQVYNLGSSHSHSMRDILDRLLAQSRVAVRVEVDPALVRPIDIPEVVCDCTRFKRDTGWEPQYDLDQTLRDVLDDWRKRVRTN